MDLSAAGYATGKSLPMKRPDVYFSGTQNGMGYILEEHFVTVLRLWYKLCR